MSHGQSSIWLIPLSQPDTATFHHSHIFTLTNDNTNELTISPTLHSQQGRPGVGKLTSPIRIEARQIYIFVVDALPNLR